MPNIKTNGRVIVITGPMFSGKTSTLIHHLEREQYAENKIAVFKPRIDNRYSAMEIVTHAGQKLSAIVVPTGEEAYGIIMKSAKNVGVVGIEEAQFFSKDANIPKLIMELSKGRRVIVTVLNKDHTGEVFGNAGEILAKADEIECLTAICRKCRSDGASFTQRVDDKGTPIFGEQVHVGGKEDYEPRCRDCFVFPEGKL